MVLAVFLLLLATWMAELALIGLWTFALVGAVLMAGAGVALEVQRRRLTQPRERVALAAMGRAAGSPRRRQAVGVRTLPAR